MDLLNIFKIKENRYKINYILGEGSHSKVWHAKNLIYPFDEIAIKIAKEDKISCERVNNEIWFLKEIKHDNIIKLLGNGKIKNDIPWLAMEYFKNLYIKFSYRGKFIKADISNIKPNGYPKISKKIPLIDREKIAASVLLDISDVICYISGTSIVHADINPCNIMINEESILNKKYILIDWGASSLLYYHHHNQNFGSLHFTAPERLFENIHLKSDLFSLGVTCFYIITGTVPYYGDTAEEYYLTTIKNEGISVSDIENKVYPPLNKLIKDLIQKNPEKRPDAFKVFKRIQKIKKK